MYVQQQADAFNQRWSDVIADAQEMGNWNWYDTHDSFIPRINDKSLRIPSSFKVHSLVNKSPDDGQRVQYQTVHVLFFPTWLVRSSTSPGWSNGVPGTAASGLWGIRHRVIHSPELPARGWSLLHITVLSAHAAVPHGSTGWEAGPKLHWLQLFYGES